ncbi:hypothetical protein ACIQGZ_20605 [Streptomyces sp. NPDC092296]|uniref:hypothetical protein n=1 Tax=Streptomyces sp. NPDC092296 TaxID=3366012 RepID=UPI00382D063C
MGEGATEAEGPTRTATQLQPQAILRQHFPATRNTALDHPWSGVLGVPRVHEHSGLARTSAIARVAHVISGR